MFGRAPVPRSSNEIDFEAAPAPASRSLFSASAGMPPDPAEMSSSPFPDIHARAKGIQKPHDVDSCFGLTERQTFQPRPTPQEHTQHFSQYARSSKRLTLDQPLGMIVGGNVRPPGSQHIAPAMRSGTATFRSARHLTPYALVAARSGDSEEDKLAGPDLVAAKGETDPLHQIIALQSFDGSWELNDKFLEVLKLSWSKVKSRVSSPSEEKVWATVLAICFLEKKMAEQKDAWELVVDKARVWLSGVAKDGFVEKLVQVAETLF